MRRAVKWAAAATVVWVAIAVVRAGIEIAREGS